MNYFDIHTHHSSSAQGSAIVNSYPEDFVVSEGKFYSVGIHPWRAHLASEETMQAYNHSRQLNHDETERS